MVTFSVSHQIEQCVALSPNKHAGGISALRKHLLNSSDGGMKLLEAFQPNGSQKG